MKSYYEIKDEELEVTEGYSDKKLDRYILICRFIRYIYDEKLFWTVSLLPMIVFPCILNYLGLLPITPIIAIAFIGTHFIYWHFKGKSDVKKMIDDIMPELDMTIDVLEEIREERNG
jgi:hypothetical protein